MQRVACALDFKAKNAVSGNGDKNQNDVEQPEFNSREKSSASSQGIGSIHSRRDTVRQFEVICRYLEINEPTSPAPFLIKRAIRFMEMNFMDILKEMAPDGLNQAAFITGVEPSSDA